MSPCRPAPARPVHRRHSGPNPHENAAAAPGVVPRQLEFHQNTNIINSLQKSGVQVGSGSISARTGSQTPSSKTTTRSSTPHAPLGKSSSPNPKRSPPSECAIGLTSVSRYDPWYNFVGAGRRTREILRDERRAVAEEGD